MRDLKPGDRVKITGPWSLDDPDGGEHIGKFAEVLEVVPVTNMYVFLEIDGPGYRLYWCRENLRALPRRK